MSSSTRLFVILMNLIALLCMMVFLFSCTTTEKATNILIKRQALAGVCRDKFPVDTQVKVVSDTVIKYDTVKQEFSTKDTIETKDTVFVMDHKVEVQTVTKYIHDTKTVTLKDSAELQLLHDQINSLNVRHAQDSIKLIQANEKNTALNKDLKQKKYQSLIRLFIIIGLLAFVLRQPLVALVKTVIGIKIPFLNFLKK